MATALRPWGRVDNKQCGIDMLVDDVAGMIVGYEAFNGTRGDLTFEMVTERGAMSHVIPELTGRRPIEISPVSLENAWLSLTGTSAARSPRR